MATLMHDYMHKRGHVYIFVYKWNCARTHWQTQTVSNIATS